MNLYEQGQIFETLKVANKNCLLQPTIDIVVFF